MKGDVKSKSAVVASDLEFKSAFLQSFKDAQRFYTDLVGSVNKNNKKTGNKTNNRQSTKTSGIQSIDKNLLVIIGVLNASTKMLVDAINKVSTAGGKDKKGVLSAIKGSQEEIAAKSKKNTVEQKVGKFDMPDKTIKKLGAEIQKSEAKALSNNQKNTARVQKSNDFVSQLTGKKPEKEKNTVLTKNEGKSGKRSKFDMKGFLSGLGTILASILNPVAMVMAFIQKFLPYVLIFGAMLYGVWEGMGDELRAKFTDIAKKVLKYVAIIFAAWKGLPLIIRLLALARETLAMAFLFKEHRKKMAAADQEIVLTRTVHSTRIGAVIFDRLMRMLEFVFKSIANAIDMVLRGIEFALRCAAIALIIVLAAALITLIVMGIAAIFLLVAKAATDVIHGLLDFAIDMISEMVDVIVNIATVLFTGLGVIIKSLLSGVMDRPDNSTQNQNGEGDSKSLSTKLRDDFTATFDCITAPLNSILEVVQNIKDNQSSLYEAMTGKSITQSMFGGGNQLNNTWSKNYSMTMASDSASTLIDTSIDNSENGEESDNSSIVEYLDKIDKHIINIIDNQISLSVNGRMTRPQR